MDIEIQVVEGEWVEEEGRYISYEEMFWRCVEEDQRREDAGPQ